MPRRLSTRRKDLGQCLHIELRASRKLKSAGNVEAAKEVGALIAKKCLEKGIQKVVFDRNGYLYHGRIKALAEAARAKGLIF